MSCYWIKSLWEKEYPPCMLALCTRFEDFLRILDTLTILEGEEIVAGWKIDNGKY